MTSNEVKITLLETDNAEGNVQYTTKRKAGIRRPLQLCFRNSHFPADTIATSSFARKYPAVAVSVKSTLDA